MKKLFTLLISLLSATVMAQNYQCLQTGVKHYFTNSYGYLRGIRIDSVNTYSDSVIYYPYHTPRGRYSLNPNLDSTGGSWLGKKVIELVDGTFLFDNIWNDTVVIKTQANIGDSWVFYNDTTSLYYMAQLLSIDTMTINGTVDSIKKILITAHNPSGIVTTDPVDSFQIILSKSNGFAQIFDLYTFPYHAPDSNYRGGFDFYLDNMLSYYDGLPMKANSIFSLIQLINPSYEQLYQWNVGDVYEYSICNDYFEHYEATCNPVEYYYMDTISSISITRGNANYNFNGWMSIFDPPFPPTTLWPSGPFIYSTTANNGVLTYDSTLLIDTAKMPEEKGKSNLYSYMPNDSSYCIVSTLYTILGWSGIGTISNEEYYPIFEGFVGPTTYKSPLGLLNSYEAYQDYGVVVYAKNLIYYQRGGDVCGSLDIPPTAVNIISLPEKIILLSPNPANDELTIQTNSMPCSISIINVIGQIIKRVQTNKLQETINVSDMLPGIYNVNIRTESGYRENSKIVIMH